MIEFPKYAKVKDRYCISYFGPSDEYLLQLKLLKPIFERHFPGLHISFGCRDDRAHLFDPSDVMKITEIKARRQEYGEMLELAFNGTDHPVEEFLKNSGVSNYVVRTDLEDISTAKCLIVVSGNYPTKNLEKHQIDQIKKSVTEYGYFVEIGTDLRGAGLVVGVESMALFEAAARGIKTRLIPTGIGTRLYRNMFPLGEILSSVL